MGWSVGFDSNWDRDIGYGVPATCDHPGCGKRIDRGLAYVCGGDAYGGEYGCGLFFCYEHLQYADVEDECVQLCERCANHEDAFTPTPDVLEWVNWKLTDESWQRWRDESPDEVAALKLRVQQSKGEQE